MAIDRSFYLLVKELRDSQKLYFKTRTSFALNKCRAIERRVDNDLKKRLDRLAELDRGRVAEQGKLV